MKSQYRTYNKNYKITRVQFCSILDQYREAQATNFGSRALLKILVPLLLSLIANMVLTCLKTNTAKCFTHLRIELIRQTARYIQCQLTNVVQKPAVVDASQYKVFKSYPPLEEIIEQGLLRFEYRSNQYVQLTARANFICKQLVTHRRPLLPSFLTAHANTKLKKELFLDVQLHDASTTASMS